MGTEYKEGTFTNKRGDELYYRTYLVSSPKAFLVYHHGYGAHCALMHKEYLFLQRLGIASLVYDAVSFGRSVKDPARRSLITKFEHLPADLETFCEDVVAKHQPSTPVPVFVGGQSMGGMTAIMTGLRRPQLWSGLVLTSPAIDVKRDLPLKIMEFLSPVMLRICPNVRLVPAIPLEAVSRKPAVQERLRADPLMDFGNLRVRMGMTFVEAWNWIKGHEREMQLPVFVTWDPEDAVVFPPAIQRFLGSIQSKDVTPHQLAGYQHEPLLNQEGTENVQIIADWILKRCGPSKL